MTPNILILPSWIYRWLSARCTSATTLELFQSCTKSSIRGVYMSNLEKWTQFDATRPQYKIKHYYSKASFLNNIHNRYPITCPTGWGGWGCEVSCGGHHRPRGKTTTGSALDGAVFDIAQILAYLVHNMSRSQFYLGFGHFVWLPSFFGQ